MAVDSVSVVVPALNEELYVRGALKSVAMQRWRPSLLEAVVVDNGSTDGTARVVRSFAEEETGLTVRLVAEPRQGVARAKNAGARAAQGRWLVFLDADSRMAPDLIGNVMEWVRRGYPAGSIRVRADSEDWLDRAFFDLIEFGKKLFHIRAQMCYCARELFERMGGFDEALHLAEDKEFLDRLQGAGVPVCHVSESWIATSPRRLRSLPFRLGMVAMFARWALAHWGVGRRWRY